jgi:hypothetical protein
MNALAKHVLALAAGTVLLSASAEADTTVKIGFINTYSGPFAQAGDELDKGVRLYIKEHEKDLPPGSRSSSSCATTPGRIRMSPSAWRRS